MSEQLVLPGFSPPRAAAHRLFFATLPPPHVAEQVSGLTRHLRREIRLTGAPLATSCLHVSLHMLGDYEDEIPGRLIEAAADAASAVAACPFEVTFDHVMSFYRKAPRRAFVLRSSGDMTELSSLHRLIGQGMKRAGLGHRVGTHFTPHMTLLYDRRLVDVQTVEEIRWTVSDFALVHSLLGRGIHNRLAHWSLRG